MRKTDLHGRISAALLRGDLRGGGLLSVPEATKTPSARHPSPNLSCLTTSLAAATLATLRNGSHRAAIQSELLGVGDDWSCWVLSYRVDAEEVVFFVPLVGSESRKLIEEARTSGIRLLFTTDEDSEALEEAHVPALGATAAPLMQHWRLRLGWAAPDSLLQTMDILLSRSSIEPREEASSASPKVTLAVVIPEDVQGALAEQMPDLFP